MNNNMNKSRSHVTSDTDNVYFNTSIKNTSNITSSDCRVSIIRTVNILDVASDYYMAITRFRIPYGTLPVIVLPRVSSGSTSIQLTLTISSAANPLESITPDLSVIPGIGSSPYTYEFIGDYCHIYLVHTLEVIINYMFETLFFTYPAASITSGVTYIAWPVVEWSFADKHWNIQWPIALLDSTHVNYTAFSYYLYEILGPVHGNVLSYDITDAEYFQWNPTPYMTYTTVNDYLFTAAFYNATGATDKQIFDESSIENPFALAVQQRRLLIKTGSIPSEPEAIDNGSVYEKILTDFLIPSGLPYDGPYVYAPPSQYRLIDLKSAAPLRQIDINVYWQDRFLNIYNFRLPPKSEASFKIGFFYQGLYNNLYAENPRPSIIQNLSISDKQAKQVLGESGNPSKLFRQNVSGYYYE
jgi:hypothetical protein